VNEAQGSPEPTLAPESPRPAGGEEGRAREVFVLVAIAAVSVLFIALVAIIYHKSVWNRPAAPTAILVVRGSERWNGARITIEGPSEKTLTGTITKEGEYACTFHVPPGTYSVRVSIRGWTSAPRFAEVGRWRRVIMQLSEPGPSQPTD